MSDFVQDMKDVTEQFNRWANANAIIDDDFKAIDTLLQKHYDQRSALFEVMLKILEQPDEELSDNWQRVCDQALDQLDRLNSAIPSRAADGLKGIGLGSFLEGEKKVWQENRKATIATIAEVISDIGRNDDELIKKLEDDLKRAREDGKVIDELVRVTFRETGDSMRELATRAASEGATKAVAMIPSIGAKIAATAGKTVSTVATARAKISDFKKKKRAYKDVIVGNRKKIEDLKEKINDDVIKNARQRGIEFADSLKGIGSNGDYKAADWETFAKGCREKLNNRSEPAIAKAQYLYQTVYPAYIDGLKLAFATLASDPASLASFKGELDDQTQKVYEALEKDKEVVQTLRDNPDKREAWRVLQQIKDDVTAAIKDLKDAIKDAEEEMLANS